jgi:hypothetical protein
VAPPSQTPLQQAVSDTVSNVGAALSQGVQQVGAGATTAAANALNPKGNAVTVPLSLPFTRTQLLVMGAIAAAIIYFRR